MSFAIITLRKELLAEIEIEKEGKITQIDFFLPYPLTKKKTTTENVLTDPLPKSISDFQDQLDPGE